MTDTDDLAALVGRKHRGCDGCPSMWDEGWVDLIIPNAVWEQISPQSRDGESGGYLCAHCLTSRLTKAGISDVPVRAYGRPFWTGTA
jgi:hypothetical protein